MELAPNFYYSFLQFLLSLLLTLISTICMPLCLPFQSSSKLMFFSQTSRNFLNELICKLCSLLLCLLPFLNLRWMSRLYPLFFMHSLLLLTVHPVSMQAGHCRCRFLLLRKEWEGAVGVMGGAWIHWGHELLQAAWLSCPLLETSN